MRSPRLQLIGLAVGIIPTSLACSSSEFRAAEPGDPESDAAARDTLSPEERAAGFRLLFDGESLDGWRGFRRSDPPAGWTASDGTLRFRPGRDGGDLITVEQFSDFELRLEWKVSPGGNSGILFRATEEEDRVWKTGPEMQVLDDARHPDGGTPETSAGANYALHAPAFDVVRPAGEWNEVLLRVVGPRVEHWLNGRRVVDYELWSHEWEARVANTKFAEMPAYGRSRSGHIALQDHGNEVWYRHLRVRPVRPVDGSGPREPRLLVLTRTAGYRHASIEPGVRAIREIADSLGLGVDVTDDAAAFTVRELRPYRAVVFLHTTGDVLGPPAQAAFEEYIRGGGGYVGVHAAADAEYEWPWYGELVGAWFESHPPVQTATVRVRDASHPSTRGLPAEWVRTDEWYDYRAPPADEVRVLLTLDESTYEGGSMGDHPIAWYHHWDGGRAWYTGLGHTPEAWAEPRFLRHLTGGIAWAAGSRSGETRSGR